jgi:hypothetical protein
MDRVHGGHRPRGPRPRFRGIFKNGDLTRRAWVDGYCGSLDIDVASGEGLGALKAVICELFLEPCTSD